MRARRAHTEAALAISSTHLHNELLAQQRALHARLPDGRQVLKAALQCSTGVGGLVVMRRWMGDRKVGVRRLGVVARHGTARGAARMARGKRGLQSQH